MRIGKYIFRRASIVKYRLINRKRGSNEDIARMLQIYNSRFCGICFFRDEASYEKMKKEIFKIDFK